jgi:hypothetical protein
MENKNSLRFLPRFASQIHFLILFSVYLIQPFIFLRFGEGGKGVGDEITQQTLLPEVRDPNLWIVKCRIGEEKVSQL